MAAFVAEQKSADHSGKLLRFGPSESGARTGAGACSVARAGVATRFLLARGFYDCQAAGHCRFLAKEYLDHQ
jgi:hypothetical protein